MKCCRCLSAVLVAASALAEPPSVRVLDEPTRVEVTAGHPITVALLDDTAQPGPAIFGIEFRDGPWYVFRPRFALTPGAYYRATAGGESTDFRIASPGFHEAATVTAVWPTCVEVPANLLKFYLHFSRPMREGREIFTHIRLLDSRGGEIGAPWRDTELWTEDARRLTLWIHPGRIKQGVNLREQLGPVMRPGERYTLVVDAALRDATGQPLGGEFRRTFTATVEVRARLDLANWELNAPRAGTREPVRAVAPVALDHALALRCLCVRGVEGMALLAEDGRTWSFTPSVAWKAEPYTLIADPWLEDLAGNTFERAFDDDVTAPPGKPVSALREFTPR